MFMTIILPLLTSRLCECVLCMRVCVFAIVCFDQGVMMLLSHTEVPQGAARPGICNSIV